MRMEVRKPSRQLQDLRTRERARLLLALVEVLPQGAAREVEEDQVLPAPTGPLLKKGDEVGVAPRADKGFDLPAITLARSAKAS